MSNQPHQMPIGVDDFRELHLGDHCFVDKTLLIQELLADSTKAFLITRPRRFGKTINMSMIKYFFDIQDAAENRKLFEDTLIAGAKDNKGKPCMDQQGKYPVVFLTFKDLRASNMDEMYADLQSLLSDLYKEHQYLLSDGNSQLTEQDRKEFQEIIDKKSNKSDLKLAIKRLTAYLKAFHNQPVLLLLDEYDTPMHSAFSAKMPFHDDLANLMMGLVGAALKGNNALKQGILTGILRVSLMNLFSGANNITVYSMLDEFYADYFGFFESEVERLFDKVNIDLDLKKIKSWYNGYFIGGKTLYNPWSIISCLRWKGQTKTYWLQSGEHGVIGKALIASYNMQTFNQLQDLIDDKPIDIELSERTVFADISKNQRALWSLLLYSGYLTPVKIWFEGSKQFASLKAPNEEVKNTFTGIVENWTKMPGTGDAIYIKLVAALQEGNVQGFRDIIQQYILETISYYDLDSNTEERFYHIFMLGIILTLKDQFSIDSNREAGYGRYDIILIPRDKSMPGVVIELKRANISDVEKYELKNDELKKLKLMDKAANTALAQIESRQYAIKFAQHDIKQFFCIGMAFLGKDVAVRGKQLSS